MTTLLDIRTAVRLRTNTENNDFVTDAELTGYANDSLADLDDTIVNLYEDYKLTSVQEVITSNVQGQNYFSLPADFLKARGVSRQFSGAWMTVYRYTHQQRNMYSYPLSYMPYGYTTVYYKIQDGKCFIIPYQCAAATYQLDYVPRFVRLVSDSDALPDHLDTQSWFEYAVVDCCIKVNMKQDLDVSQWMARKNELQMRIINAAKNRDAGPPKHIVDTRSGRAREGWGPGRGGW